MRDGESGFGNYWIDGPEGCPIGGPFDLWRKDYFHANGEPPEDTAVMYPSLSAPTVTDIAVVTVSNDATLEDVLSTFGDRGPEVELTAAYQYFSQWRKRAPFMPDSMQDLPLLPARGIDGHTHMP